MTETDTITLAPQDGPQTAFFESPADIVIYGGAAGGGKVVANNGIVLAPHGWKLGSELCVGDLLNNPDGSIQRIIQIKPEVYLDKWVVEFSDGTSTDVAEDHLWLAWRGRKGRKINNRRVFGEPSAEVVETKALLDWLERGYAPQIPVCKPQSFNRTTKESHKIDPYLLGVLLGDGCITTKQPTISCGESDKEHYRRIFGDIDTEYGTHNNIRFVGEKRKRLIEKLQLHGLFGTNSKTKFIPEVYKWSSIESRRQLVKGLMDTDGWSAKDKNACYYDTVSKQLADDTAFVLRSLGAIVTITMCNDVYHLYIRIEYPDTLFSLARKKQGEFGRNLVQKRVVSVTVNGKIRGRCITVSNPNGLYITNDFIVTHNSYALLLEAIRHIDNKDFRFTLFRRTQQQLSKAGGLWDESQKIYSLVNGDAREMGHKWTFPSGAKGDFSGMQYEKDKLDFQSAQICYIGFDQLEQFTESQFMFMLSRNRSVCGVDPYVRAAANPEPGWLADFLAWWIADDGYADMSRAGKLRWLIRDGDKILWFDTQAKSIAAFGRDKEGNPTIPPLSVTFIPASVYDNKILLETDPKYIANLMALPSMERKRLLGDRVRGGNWHIKPGGTKFKREWFSVVNDYPHDAIAVRYWDLAATAPKKGKNPDFTAGCLMVAKAGQYWIVDMRHDRLNPAAIEKLLGATWQQDGNDIPIRMEQEGGSSGKISVQYFARHVLVGADFAGIPSTKSKEIRANPVSAAAEAGNVFMVRGEWNKNCLDELESFSPECDHDDQVDAISGAFSFLSLQFLNPSVYSDSTDQNYAEKVIDDKIEALLADMTPEERAEAIRVINEEG